MGVKIQHRDRDAKMPMVKLTYFDLEGRGELIRLLLHAGNIDFEDFRFGFGERAKHKPNTPFGSVPVLHWDGERWRRPWPSSDSLPGRSAWLARQTWSSSRLIWWLATSRTSSLSCQ